MTIHTLSISETLKGLSAKSFSSVEATKECLNASHKHNPKLNAFVTICENEALKQAFRADELRAQGQEFPLLGIPIVVKDNFCTIGIRTTASSKMLDKFIPPYDATVIQRLKNAGAVIIGKTNMDAWAHGSSTETSDYGSSRNPWDITKSPGGSSGGSAAAVASDCTIAGIGSETAGSIRGPASWCGIVGFKPTYGRVSRYGVIAMGSSLDSPGPLTKTVWDSALIMEVLAGHDRYDATTSPKSVPKYSKELLVDMKSLTVGVPNEYLHFAEKKVAQKIEEALDVFASMGAKIKRITLLDPKYAIAVYTIIQRSEVSSNLGRYDGIRFGFGRAKFGEEAVRRIMLGTYTLSAGYYDAYYKKAQKIRTLIINDFERVFRDVDLIVGPTMPSVALPVGSSKDHPMFGEAMDALVEASSIAGLPGINVPCGFINELPVGCQIIGPQFSEQKILAAAYSYEQKTQWHTRKPKL